MPMYKWAIQLQTSLAHNVWHNEFSHHDDDDSSKMSLLVLAVQLLDFHMKIILYTAVVY